MVKYSMANNNLNLRLIRSCLCVCAPDDREGHNLRRIVRGAARIISMDGVRKMWEKWQVFSRSSVVAPIHFFQAADVAPPRSFLFKPFTPLWFPSGHFFKTQLKIQLLRRRRRKTKWFCCVWVKWLVVWSVVFWLLIESTSPISCRNSIKKSSEILFKISTRTTCARRQCRVCVPVCFSFPLPSPKEPKGFPRVLMVFPAVILSTATTRQSTSAMSGCLYQRLLFMLVMVTTGGAGQDTGSSSDVRILAVFRSIRNGNDGTGHAQDPDCTQH